MSKISLFQQVADKIEKLYFEKPSSYIWLAHFHIDISIFDEVQNSGLQIQKN